MDDKLYQIAQDVAETKADVKHILAAISAERAERLKKQDELEGKIDEQGDIVRQLEEDRRVVVYAGRIAAAACVLVSSGLWWLGVHVPAEAWVLILRGMGFGA